MSVTQYEYLSDTFLIDTVNPNLFQYGVLAAYSIHFCGKENVKIDNCLKNEDTIVETRSFSTTIVPSIYILLFFYIHKK